MMTTLSRPNPPRRKAASSRLRALVLVIASGAVAVAAGCGGSGSPAAAVSASKSPASGSRYQQTVKFSQCMRTHGVAGFPDPQATANGGGALLIHAGPGSAIDPSSPAFQSAQQACAKLLPNGGRPGGGAIPAQAKQQALKYSACMRTHGVPGFPDPQFVANGMRLQLNLSTGVNPATPAFKAAQKACGSPFPGGIVKGNNVGGPS